MHYNKTYIIGDSHAWFLSQDPEILTFVHEKDISKWPKPHQYGHFIDKGVQFYWKTGTTAYSLTEDTLSNICLNNNIKTNSNLVFVFGAIDLHAHLDKYKNTEHVVDKYVDLCKSFADKFFCNSYFITPFYNGYSKEYYRFVGLLKNKCIELGISAPIQISGNVIPQHFNGEDAAGHISRSDAVTCLKYLLNYLND